MKLSEFLEVTGCPITKFAKRVGVSAGTIKNLLLQKYDIRLSVAIKIENATMGQVTCRELVVTDLTHKSNKKQSEGKKHQNQKE